MNTNFLKTQKNILKVVLLLTLSISFFNCSKDEEPVATPAVVAPEQNPLPGFLTATGFDQAVNPLVDGFLNIQQGFSFVPLVDGKMTAIVVKLTDANPDLKVYVWDKTTGTPIISETVNVTTAGAEVVKVITPINLVKDKEYLISILSADRYIRNKTDESPVTYPITVGDIKITSCNASATGALTTLAMPTRNQPNNYYGDCSFKFQK